MTDGFRQSDAGFDPGGIDFSRVPQASLLRAAADGELDAEGEARLGEHLSSHPGMERAIAFDAGLRTACGRAMGAVSVPAGLADRVRSALERDARILADEDADREASFAAGIEARASRTRDRSFWQTGPGRAVAGLAAVLLIAVAGLNFGSLVGAFGGGGAGGAGPVAQGDNPYRVQLAQFVANEHERVTSTPEAADRKFRIRDELVAAQRAAEALGQSPEIPHCGEGRLTFGGSGPCAVPGTGKSTHLRFLVNLPDALGLTHEVPVSVFVKKDAGEMSLSEGVTYKMNTETCGVEGQSIYVWAREGLVYVMVARLPDTPGCDAILTAMGVPPPAAEL